MITIFQLDRTVHARLIQELGCYINKLEQDTPTSETVDVILFERVILKQNGTRTTIDKGGILATIDTSNYHYIAIS